MEGCFKQITELVPEADWDLGLRVWSNFLSFPHQVSPLPKPKPKPGASCEKSGVGSAGDAHKTDNDKQESEPCTHTEAANNTAEQHDIEPEVKKLKVIDLKMLPFRAACNRTGTKHLFRSPEAAAQFCGAIQDYFGWNVNLKNFDIEAMLTIEDNHVHLSIALTKESLHGRHLVQFGPTSLRPTIAYGMLRLCQIQPGDVVCDPMCGGGSIPIEATLNWPLLQHLCGAYHEQAMPRTATNMQAVNKVQAIEGRLLRKDSCGLWSALYKNASPLGMVRWDASNLPLKDNSNDVFISDLPFGKRSGSKVRNWRLYPSLLRELARVCKQNSGRACLLTQDKKCILKSLQQTSPYWRRGATLGINIEGLAAAVYLLYRTGQPFSSDQNRTKPDGEKPAF